jgi:PAS domain S-box-containing protein
MNDEEKTKDQLIQELEGLRWRIVELEKSETERKKVEEALQQSEDKFKLAFQANPDAIIFNRLHDGMIVDINQRFTDLSGFTREDVIGRTTLALNFWSDPADRARLAKGLREGGFYENLEAQFRKKDGSFTTTLMSARVLMLWGVPHILSIIRDISERKRIEDKIQKSEKYLNSILAGITDSVFTISSDFKILWANKAALAQVGKPLEEIIDQPCHFITHRYMEECSLHAQACPIKEARDTGAPAKAIHTHFDGQGDEFIAEVAIYPIEEKNGKITQFVHISRDVTEYKRAEERIKTLLEEKELLLQEVHHRIKNNMLVMMTLLTLQSKTLKDPQAIAALGDAKSRLQSMSVLYDKLYRTESLQEMSIREYLPGLVDEIIGIFPNKATVKTEKRIEDFILSVNIMSPLGIITNEILTNTMKYAFIGRDDGLIMVSATIKDHCATLIIEDNGNGIPESIDIETSTGFGLQLIRMLTKQINGTIKIERGQGTRFVLEFGA